MRQPRRSALQAIPLTQDSLRLNTPLMREIMIAVAVLVLATLALSSRAFAEGSERESKKDAKEYEEKLKQQREDAERRNEQLKAAGNPDLEKKLREADRARREKDQQKADYADYKEKTYQNLAQVKETYENGKAAFKEKQYAKATAYYKSVAGATVAGSEEMAKDAREKLIGMETLAKERLKAAEDADQEGNYIKEVEELMVIMTEFKDTKIRDVAQRRIINLQSKPEVAAETEYIRAQALLTQDGKMLQGMEILGALANNPRYENTVAQFKAKRKLDELNENDEARGKMKNEHDEKMEKDAPALIAAAKNYSSNHNAKLAREKLNTVIERYPDSRFAEEARKQLEALKDVK
jgi:hypothetical protein